MLWLLLEVVFVVWHCISVFVNALVQVLLVCTLTCSLLYGTGWCHRWLWAWMERTASEELNGTLVTIGSFSLDLLRGHLSVTNVIVHAPQRHVYHWESPVLGRIGRLEVEFNPLSCLCSALILLHQQRNNSTSSNDESSCIKLDVTLLYMSDVQCFLERKAQVFNVYLLDPLYVLPKSTMTAASSTYDRQPSSPMSLSATAAVSSLPLKEPAVLFLENTEPEFPSNSNNTASTAHVNNSNNANPNNGAGGGGGYSVAVGDEEKAGVDGGVVVALRAEQVVGEMLKTVQSLGRAVQEGQLPQALQEQRHRITNRLREFQLTADKKNHFADGLSLVQQVSGLVVQKSKQAVQHSNRLLQLQPIRQQPPQPSASHSAPLSSSSSYHQHQQHAHIKQPPPKLPLVARFGRVILDDLRVFTRTTMAVEETIKPSTPARAQNNPTSNSNNNTNNGEEDDEGEGVEVTSFSPRQTPTTSPAAEAVSPSAGGGSHVVVVVSSATAATPSPPRRPTGGGSVDDSVGTSKSYPGTNSRGDGVPSSSATRNAEIKTPVPPVTAAAAAAATLNNSSMPKNASVPTTNTTTTATTTTSYRSYWNKPITVERVAVRASEFGAPLQAKDERGFPVLFQPIDRAVDAILKRVVGDMAKCNTGRLMRTAMGEVLDFYMENEWHDNNNNP